MCLQQLRQRGVVQHVGQAVRAHQVQVAGHHLFLGRRDGIAERRGDRGRQAQARPDRMLAQFHQQEGEISNGINSVAQRYENI